eukprot:1853-Heterococcus_DN1.PRE.5
MRGVSNNAITPDYKLLRMAQIIRVYLFGWRSSKRTQTAVMNRTTMPHSHICKLLKTMQLFQYCCINATQMKADYTASRQTICFSSAAVLFYSAAHLLYYELSGRAACCWSNEASMLGLNIDRHMQHHQRPHLTTREMFVVPCKSTATANNV